MILFPKYLNNEASGSWKVLIHDSIVQRMYHKPTQVGKSIYMNVKNNPRKLNCKMICRYRKNYSYGKEIKQ